MQVFHPCIVVVFDRLPLLAGQRFNFRELGNYTLQQLKIESTFGDHDCPIVSSGTAEIQQPQHWPPICRSICMPAEDDAVAREFIERLDRGELNGHLSVELPRLSYEQLLRVAKIIAERIESQVKR